MLLDIKMPGIDGIETLRQIKAIDKTIAVIILSAHGTLQTHIEAIRLGALDSIAKPFDLKDMLQVIQGVVANASENKEAPTGSRKSKK